MKIYIDTTCSYINSRGQFGDDLPYEILTTGGTLFPDDESATLLVWAPIQGLKANTPYTEPHEYEARIVSCSRLWDVAYWPTYAITLVVRDLPEEDRPPWAQICTCPDMCELCAQGRGGSWLDHPECGPDPHCPRHGTGAAYVERLDPQTTLVYSRCKWHFRQPTLNRDSVSYPTRDAAMQSWRQGCVVWHSLSINSFDRTAEGE